MPKLAGLLTGTLLLLFFLNLSPGVQVAWLWQAGACSALAVVNLVVWKRTKPPAMPLREAVVTASVGLAWIVVVAVVDTGIGLLLGAETVSEAFIHSGAFGGIADAFLLACGVFVGLPILVKSVYEFRLRQASNESRC